MIKVLLFCFFAISPALAVEAPTQGEAFSQKQRELVKIIENYFNGISSIKSRFYQVSNNGGTAQGDFYVLKADKMRLEYDPPHPVEVIADGYYLIFHDKKLEQVTYLDLNDNPASMMLKENFSFEKEGLSITSFAVEAGTVSVSVIKKSQPNTGKITLVFQEKPLTLKQWQVVDAQQITTTVTLDNMETNVKLDEALFKFKAPKKKSRPGDLPKRK